MIAFDTDVLTELLRGRPDYVTRAAAIPPDQQTVPIVVVEEIMRGRLAAIRRAEAKSGDGAARVRAYASFRMTFVDFMRFATLEYDARAERQFADWRAAGVRVATHDLRIAAICVSQQAKLVTRNKRDFDVIPGLFVEYWN